MTSDTISSQRYPISLSQASSSNVSGPSRSRQRPNNNNRGYNVTPSIDSSVGSGYGSASNSIPNSSQHEYSSLEELLQKAGYKETRVFTPETEKIQKSKSKIKSKSTANLRSKGNNNSSNSRIKKTFDQVEEDEVNSLYGTYGFKRNSTETPNNHNGIINGLNMDRINPQDSNYNNGVERIIIKHQHITEPGLPMKTSSSILRSLAIQDQIISSSSPSSLPKDQEMSVTNESSWWNGWVAGNNSNYNNKLKINDTPTSSYEPSKEIGVGLGLAKNGLNINTNKPKVKAGVRKVKSTYEISNNQRKSTRRAGTDSPPQEERPPLPEKYQTRQRVISSPTDLMSNNNNNHNNTNSTTAIGYTSRESQLQSQQQNHNSDIFGTFSPPPPQLINEDEYGYSPLPDDYEEQCTEDEVLYSMGINNYPTSIYSLGSYGSNSNSHSDLSSLPTNSLLKEDDNSSFMNSSNNNNNDYNGEHKDEEEYGNETISTITETIINSTRENSEERAVREINEFQQFQQFQYHNQQQQQQQHQQYNPAYGYEEDEYDIDSELIDQVNNEAGRRILESAVNVDQLDFDSPESQTTDLPEEVEEVEYEENDRLGMDNGVPRIPLPITPQPPSYDYDDSQEEIPQFVIEEKKQLKYGDRATKLRIAHSTPQLRQAAMSSATSPPLPEGWLGSIRSALLGGGGKSSEPITPIIINNAISQPKGPIKISIAKPALPTLITTSPVICDSHSNEARDLPPIPNYPINSRSINHTTSISNLALRFRPSLAKLKDAVLGSNTSTENRLPKQEGEEEEDVEDNLILSPRLNWDEQGKQFAGWSPYRSKVSNFNNQFTNNNNNNNSNHNIDGLFGPQPDSESNLDSFVVGSEIDYTKSFFYKPITPPSKMSSKNKNDNFSTPPSKNNNTSSSSTSTNDNSSSSLNKKRSIKTLKAALLLPVAPSIPSQNLPEIPKIPEHLMHLATPRKFANKSTTQIMPPILAIQSPGSFLPRELVLEGEEWDAKDGLISSSSSSSSYSFGNGRGRNRNISVNGGGGKVRRRKSKKIVRD
ncbi:uncharacterized protein L201_002424 [Kwoniella dendrophila CBS 6074]|uniref:Uncharacterized protein n=1 Tax=Kwoniella dendrophila CBS 6074 TaxID=1295534 RepID=A0AAX4JRY7_9TREE